MLTLQYLYAGLHSQLKLLNQAFNLTKRDTAAAYNQSINNPTDYENMEKTINEIYFSTVAIGEYYFSPLQKEQITIIAFQCPLKSSAAVYKARSLYALFHPYTNFDNHAICLSQGMQYRIANTNQSQSQLSITQSGNLLQVNYSGNGNISQLKIINTLGQELSQWPSTISENQKQENLDISTLNLSSGIYILQATSTDGKVNNQKFSFNK